MSKRIKLSIVVVIGAGLTALVIFVRSNYLLPITMYHSVKPEVPAGNRLIVSVKTFDKQMQFLKKHGYKVISLEEAADMIKAKKRPVKKTVVLTFDDGYRDNYIYAFPILKKYNLAATIFIITSNVGKPDYLTWDQIKQMQDSGLISFGSHTISHPFLECIINDALLTKEVRDSKKAIEKHTKATVTSFSYPCGRINSKVRKTVVDNGYKVAVVTNPGKKMPDDDIFALKRLRISENAGNLFVFWFEISGYYNFIRENRHK